MGTIGRLFVIGVLSLLGIGQVVRQAYVAYFSEMDPAKAASVWSDHPDVAFKIDLGAIAEASGAGQPAPRDRIRDVLERSAKAPLATEPFLARGVEASLAGDLPAARKAFAAAKRRDPRSIAARYFLAGHYLKTNEIDLGFKELAGLTLLIPGSLSSVANFYAAYAKNSDGFARMKGLMRTHPDFEDPILYTLAADARNADLIMSLASRPVPRVEPPAWQGRLVQSLVTAGEFREARNVWARLSGQPLAERAQTLLSDPAFTQHRAAPPFGWTLLSSGAGSAEAEGRGRLHITYYGRDDAAMASQLLLLRPGRYRLSSRVERSTDASSLGWKLSCRPSNKPILESNFSKVGTAGPFSVGFAVEADCPAQMLELVGVAPEFPETVDLAISDLKLSAVGK